MRDSGRGVAPLCYYCVNSLIEVIVFFLRLFALLVVAEFRGRHSLPAPEYFVEIAMVGIADVMAYFPDWLTAVDEQLFSLLDAKPVDVVPESDIELFGKDVA